MFIIFESIAQHVEDYTQHSTQLISAQPRSFKEIALGFFSLSLSLISFSRSFISYRFFCWCVCVRLETETEEPLCRRKWLKIWFPYTHSKHSLEKLIHVWKFHKMKIDYRAGWNLSQYVDYLACSMRSHPSTYWMRLNTYWQARTQAHITREEIHIYPEPREVWMDNRHIERHQLVCLLSYWYTTSNIYRLYNYIVTFYIEHYINKCTEYFSRTVVVAAFLTLYWHNLHKHISHLTSTSMRWRISFQIHWNHSLLEILLNKC